jgi:hypothetical protein
MVDIRVRPFQADEKMSSESVHRQRERSLDASCAHSPEATLGESWGSLHLIRGKRPGIARPFIWTRSCTAHSVNCAVEISPRCLHPQFINSHVFPILIAIIGSGIVGLAIGLGLTTRFPSGRLVLVEKENTRCFSSSRRDTSCPGLGLLRRQ